jgi:hypothetical protein
LEIWKALHLVFSDAARTAAALTAAALGSSCGEGAIVTAQSGEALDLAQMRSAAASGHCFDF